MGECSLIVVPAAFTHTTGRRTGKCCCARAGDREPVLCAGFGAGRTHANGRRTFGHSMLIDPWGEVKAVLAEGEGVVVRRDRYRVSAKCAELAAHRLETPQDVGSARLKHRKM
jgi:predicted amidohydrolase